MHGVFGGDASGSPDEKKEYNDTKRGVIDYERRKKVLDESTELFPTKSRITDDSKLTAATIEVLLDFHYGRKSNLVPKQYQEKYKEFFYLYNITETDKDFFPTAFSKRFSTLVTSLKVNDNSAGSGSAMRVAPIAFYITLMNNIDKKKIDSININKRKKIRDIVIEQAKNSCLWSHCNSSAILWTEALALAIHIALIQPYNPKPQIKKAVEEYTGISLNTNLDEIRRKNMFSSLAEKTVPLAIIAYLNSDSFEDALRKALSLGGDTDTITSMACGLAEAEYGIPDYFRNKVGMYLDERILSSTEKFYEVLKLDEFYKNRSRLRLNKMNK